MKRAARLPLAALLAFCVGVLAPASALAGVDVHPGMHIERANGSSCTLGFLARNSYRDDLAVTAGHCSSGKVNEVFYSKNGNPVGVVVAWASDDTSNGVYGYTILQLTDNARLADRFFKGVGNASTGDYVSKYGDRTGKTDGKVIDVAYDRQYPQLSYLMSNLISLPGDSGAPWYESGPTLVGIDIMHHTGGDRSYLAAEAYPINSLVRDIRATAGEWGKGFVVLVK